LFHVGVNWVSHPQESIDSTLRVAEDRVWRKYGSIKE